MLELGLTFCRDRNADKFELIKDLQLYARQLMYKVLYDKEQNTAQDLEQQKNSVMDGVTFEDLKALQDPMELWDDSNPEEEGWVFNPSGESVGESQDQSTLPLPCPPRVDFGTPQVYKLKSKSFPILQGNSNIWAFVTKEIESTNWQTGPQSNLPKHQKQALKTLSSNKNIVVKPFDKGGNLIIMYVEQYEKMCYDIIQNTNWYRPVPMSHINYYMRKYKDILIRVLHRGIIALNT